MSDAVGQDLVGKCQLGNVRGRSRYPVVPASLACRSNVPFCRSFGWPGQDSNLLNEAQPFRGRVGKAGPRSYHLASQGPPARVREHVLEGLLGHLVRVVPRRGPTVTRPRQAEEVLHLAAIRKPVLQVPAVAALAPGEPHVSGGASRAISSDPPPGPTSACRARPGSPAHALGRFGRGPTVRARTSGRASRISRANRNCESRSTHQRRMGTRPARIIGEVGAVAGDHPACLLGTIERLARQPQQPEVVGLQAGVLRHQRPIPPFRGPWRKVLRRLNRQLPDASRHLHGP